MNVEVLGFGQDMDRAYRTLSADEDTSPYSARSMITLDTSSIHIEPGTSKNVTATIKIPQNAGAGGRYALIYFRPTPQPGQSFTIGAIIPVLITITGTTPTETGTIKTVTVGDVIPGQPINIVTTFENTGNYHYSRTVNSVVVKDATGKIIGNVSTDPAPQSIIPGNTVQYIANPVLETLPAGTYTIDSQVLISNGKVLDTKTTTFTVKSAYAPPIKESSITITPGREGTLTSSDGRYSVFFPQGAVLGDAVVALKPYSQDKLQAAPANAKFAATCFEIAGLTGLLSKDATVKVVYSTDDLAAAGGDASQLKLAYYDAAKNSWVILPTQVNTQSMTLTGTTNHLSVWAVMVSSSTSGGVAPGAAATSTPLPLTIVLTALIIAVIAAGDTVRKWK